MIGLILCDDCDVKAVAPLCRANCLGIEVQAFYRPISLEDEAQVEYHSACLSGITSRSLHGPFGDLCPGSFDPRVREVSRYRLEQGYHVAERLGAQHMVLHHGYVPHTSGRQGWLKRSVEFWLEFLEGKSPDMHFHLENLLELEPSLLSDVVSRIDKPNLSINLDIGHAQCNSQTDVLSWITTLGKQIGYVHLHDNHGETDEHLGLGQGTIPLLDVCHALNEYAPNATWAIEAEGDGIRQSLGWLSQNGFFAEPCSL